MFRSAKGFSERLVRDPQVNSVFFTTFHSWLLELFGGIIACSLWLAGIPKSSKWRFSSQLTDFFGSTVLLTCIGVDGVDLIDYLGLDHAGRLHRRARCKVVPVYLYGA